MRWCVCWLSVVCCLFCVFAFVTVAENKCETNWLNMSEWVKDVKGPLWISPFLCLSVYLSYAPALSLSLGWLPPFVAFSFSVNKVCTDNLFNTQFHWWGRGWVELTFLCTLLQPLLIHFLNTASGRFSLSICIYVILMATFCSVSVTNFQANKLLSNYSLMHAMDAVPPYTFVHFDCSIVW